MLNIAKDNKKYSFFIFFSILIIFCLIGYFLGFRIKDNFSIGKIGRVEITIPFSGTSIFIDKSKKIITTKENESVALKLSPRNHSFLVAKEGYVPWIKTISVQSGKNIELFPLFISSNTTGQVITTNDKEYYKIRNSIIYNKEPNKEKPVISKDGKVKIWLDDNAIYVESSSTTRKIIQPDSIIKNISFYKNRNDVLIFSYQTSVYVLETDTISTQNFMPIYNGKDPYFIPASESSIYIYDNNILMEVLI